MVHVMIVGSTSIVADAGPAIPYVWSAIDIPGVV